MNAYMNNLSIRLGQLKGCLNHVFDNPGLRDSLKSEIEIIMSQINEVYPYKVKQKSAGATAEKVVVDEIGLVEALDAISVDDDDDEIWEDEEDLE